MRPAGGAVAVKQDLADEAQAALAGVHEHMLEVGQALQVHTHLREREATDVENLAARDAHIVARELVVDVHFRDVGIELRQQLARVRWQLVERTDQCDARGGWRVDLPAADDDCTTMANGPEATPKRGHRATPQKRP